MSNYKRVLGFIWAAPVTVFGLAYAVIFAWLGWYRWLGLKGDALTWQHVPERSPKWLCDAWSHATGHAIGNAVIIRHAIDTDRGRITLRHQQEHVHQFMVLGAFQPILNALAYLSLKGCRYSHPHYDLPFEIDARRASGQIVDVVGTVQRAYAKGVLKPPAKVP